MPSGCSVVSTRSTRQVNVRIEMFAFRFDSRQSVLREHVPQLFLNQLKTFEMFVGFARVAVRLQRAIEAIQNGKQILEEARDAAAAFLVTVALDALAIIFKVRLAQHQRLQ